MRRRRREKRVPEVLWRRYGKKASSLCDTVLSLINPTHSDCRRLVIQPDDPHDYHYLLDHCFVVISDNAPPPPNSPPLSRWSQSQVGDAVMFYLLMWTSIFLPLPCNKYRQVAGFPMTQLLFMFPMRHQHPPGSSKKRKRIDADSTLMRPNIDFFDADAFSSCFTCFGCAGRSYSSLSSWPRTERRMKTSLHGGETEASVAYVNNGGLSIGECPARATISMPSKRKHSKASRWQRKKTRRLLSSEEAYMVCPEVKSLSNKDNHGKRSRQYRWQRHQKRRLVSSQEACNLSQCAKLNTNGDLLTDHRKVFLLKNLQGCSAFVSSSCLGVKLILSILSCQAEIIILHIFIAYLKL